ncbi:MULTISPECIES: MBOAT family O-acyltransferase [unclassified Coleofasciculus]|uniref:MBOAT family O-acyltransferase n=1 Tax=unclassified Coleofasciculus TaxID=2692782 RepID=UPI001882A7E6|nr:MULTISPECIES: MBOAT family protein [unclassified Coleofasciculus]MBE9128734.1 MBOAT family protein [Coleofasciculus sp. LEGE 07081]MBE9151816.1 MBOAT family protein [Coleofasciculus sp. LEGE 07092]
MAFVSIIYGLFLLAVLVAYWLGHSASFRLWVLVIASLFFYATLQIQYIPLLIVITLINYYLGRAIGVNTARGLHIANRRLSNEDWQVAQDLWDHRRLKLLWLGIGLNILCLVSFKYVPFVLTSIAAPLHIPAIRETGNWIGDRLIAPLGLSFFTFECIAYLIDLYRGAPATQKLLNFTAYKLFFPKLISGPITRYHQFAGEMNTLQFPSLDRLTEGLWLIGCGAFKKALLADRIGILVDLSFGNLERAGSGDLWLAIFAYGLQLYLDFSGYVDIARGSALLLGFNLPENFDFPYFSTSIADFWRRWHITLGDWIRNYLYFPLGGSRKGLSRTCLNLFVVMLIIGIWHGAAWGFVVWGGLHGLALGVHRLTQAACDRVIWLQRWWETALGVLVAWFITQLMVFISWIFFRLPSLQQAVFVLQNLWGQQADVQFGETIYIQVFGLERFQIALLFGALGAAMGVVYFMRRGLKLQLNWPVKLLLVPMCLFAVWVLAPAGGLPYIYFDF